MFKRKVILTEDGSPSLIVPELNETYHSIHGAINESVHVFINAGLSQINLSEVTVFEMGFGTGINALLSLKFAQERNIKINYITIEKYPLTAAEVYEINLEKIFPEFSKEILLMHNAENSIEISVNENFTFRKYIADIVDFAFLFNFDICFYDAFNPDVQPHLWTEEIFKKIFDSMDPGGLLCTYSAKGQVRRNLISAGFLIEKLPGPKGKREITRAVKINKQH